MPSTRLNGAKQHPTRNVKLLLISKKEIMSSQSKRLLNLIQKCGMLESKKQSVSPIDFFA